MARCPKCRHHFNVPDDEDPASFGCPSCGYGEPCGVCGAPEGACRCGVVPDCPMCRRPEPDCLCYQDED